MGNKHITVQKRSDKMKKSTDTVDTRPNNPTENRSLS